MAEMKFNLPTEDGSIIKVIGVGGGGSNAVNHMYKQGIRGVDFVVCNTDQQALDMSPVPKKIALGSSLTEGRGAGAQAEVGRNAAIENLDDIREVLENNTKMVFITAGMGGGTGTGAAPVIAEAARELGILTVGIVTVPFTFEGKKRKMQAEKGLEELKKHVDTVLVISNDKLREMYGNLKLSEAFHQADDVLTIGAKGIAEIITVEGYVNVDFEDVRTVMTNSGVAIMGSATTSGQDRAIKAVEQALASPLLNNNNIYGASNILLYISSGKDEVTMDEVAEITDYIQEEAGMDADVIWGNGTDEDLGDKLVLTVIATGFTGEKLDKITGKDNVKRHVLSQDRQAPTQEERRTERSSIPEGLTARPQLMNDRLRVEVETKKNDPNASIDTAETTAAPAQETVIRHTLEMDEDTEEEPKTILAYKVDEDDAEVNALLNEEAPELNGVREGEELRMYDEELEDDDTDETNDIVANFNVFNNTETFEATEEGQFTSETELNLPTSEEESFEEETPAMQPFSLFSTPLSFNDEAEEPTAETEDFVNEETDEVDDNIITTETPTQVVFSLNGDVEEEETEVKRFSLYDEHETEPTGKVVEPTEKTDSAPKLIVREETAEARFNSEELQRKQQERLERLKTMNQRFRSPNNLAELENVPAYKRRNIELTDTPHSSESSVSNYQVDESDDENGSHRGGLSDGNEFLHKSVD